MHLSVWLNGDEKAIENLGGFQSQVVASAPKAFEKLDQKRQTLHQLKGVLAQKLENKQKQKEKKLLNKTKNRSASVMMIERPQSRQSQERCASAMTVISNSNVKSSNYGNTTIGLVLSFFYSQYRIYLYYIYSRTDRRSIFL